jgi:hypothetical protein
MYQQQSIKPEYSGMAAVRKRGNAVQYFHCIYYNMAFG